MNQNIKLTFESQVHTKTIAQPMSASHDVFLLLYILKVLKVLVRVSLNIRMPSVDYDSTKLTHINNNTDEVGELSRQKNHIDIKVYGYTVKGDSTSLEVFSPFKHSDRATLNDKDSLLPPPVITGFMSLLCHYLCEMGTSF